jgi:bacteriochlorophyll C12 methyltransferase
LTETADTIESVDFRNDISTESLSRLVAQQKSRKKWLLVQPKSVTSMTVDSGKVSMPLNLVMVATLAGTIFDVTLVDERIGDKVPEDFSGYDVVAITSRTLNATKAYRIGDRALAQNRIVILGGVHPTMLHDEAAQQCTSVLYGEIESIWTERGSFRTLLFRSGMPVPDRPFSFPKKAFEHPHLHCQAS